ncbi:hypothetical protein GCM10007939_25160 [Amylibacter marinus]|uniref:Activator of Hsp90 ATPase homologue 1/2-like C-terminal domain-containing protein n=1 Tax=Amylibacter marinus TaxID=1475483 RepID=A0ABQ5VY98_9RHOB|nr:SRPBCC domain-containing protein [Amylibacter marinus]GLQ36232.1 hypothetical protein GCM10007939_25160 [Amylibacter marinus]
MSALPEYMTTHKFKASRDQVWHCWTDPELLARWYGPGAETTIHGYDLRVGGTWRNEMKWGEKQDFSLMEFQEISPKDLLVWLHSSVDADWNLCANPMMPDWPRQMTTRVEFSGGAGETLVKLSLIPVDASAAEIACFAAMMGGMDSGWGAGFKAIDQILAEGG